MKFKKVFESILTAGRLKTVKRMDGIQRWDLVYNKITFPITTAQLLGICGLASNSVERKAMAVLKNAIYEAILEEVKDGKYHPDTEIIGEIYTKEQSIELVEIMTKYLQKNENVLRDYLDVMNPVVKDEFVFYLYKDSIDKARSKYRENIKTMYQDIDAPIDALFSVLEKQKNNHKLRTDLIKGILTHSEEDNSIVTAQELIILATVIQPFSTQTILSVLEANDGQK